jgi:hypothetical protein
MQMVGAPLKAVKHFLLSEVTNRNNLNVHVALPIV